MSRQRLLISNPIGCLWTTFTIRSQVAGAHTNLYFHFSACPTCSTHSCPLASWTLISIFHVFFLILGACACGLFPSCLGHKQAAQRMLWWLIKWIIGSFITFPVSGMNTSSARGCYTQTQLVEMQSTTRIREANTFISGSWNRVGVCEILVTGQQEAVMNQAALLTRTQSPPKPQTSGLMKPLLVSAL